MDRFVTWPLETPIARDFRTGYADRVGGRPGLHRPAGRQCGACPGRLDQLLLEDRRAEIAERVDARIDAEADSRCRFSRAGPDWDEAGRVRPLWFDAPQSGRSSRLERCPRFASACCVATSTPALDGVADYSRRLAAHLRAVGVEPLLLTTRRLAEPCGIDTVGITDSWESEECCGQRTPSVTSA